MGTAISRVLASLEPMGTLTEPNISSNQYPESIVLVKSQILNQKHNQENIFLLPTSLDLFLTGGQKYHSLFLICKQTW